MNYRETLDQYDDVQLIACETLHQYIAAGHIGPMACYDFMRKVGADFIPPEEYKELIDEPI